MGRFRRLKAALKGGVLLGASLLTVAYYEFWNPRARPAQGGIRHMPASSPPCRTPEHLLEVQTRLAAQSDGEVLLTLLFGTAMQTSASFLASAPVLKTSWPDLSTFEIRLRGLPGMDLALITINPPGHSEAFTTACGEKMATQLLTAEIAP